MTIQKHRKQTLATQPLKGFYLRYIVSRALPEVPSFGVLCTGSFQALERRATVTSKD